jgi:hypothetical protein
VKQNWLLEGKAMKCKSVTWLLQHHCYVDAMKIFFVPQGIHIAWRIHRLIIGGMVLISMPALATVFDTTVTDVTTRAFSVVWVSDEQVTDATVKVFSDQNGASELSGLQVDLIRNPLALQQGIVKVNLSGLLPGSTVYVRTETTGLGGQVFFPQTNPLIKVVTAIESTKANQNNEPIVNDLILHKIYQPDGVSSADGALLLIKIPSISSYPLTAFVGEGYPSPSAVADLNNLFEDSTGMSAEVIGREVLEIIEFRGTQLCGANDQKLTHLRRTPPHEETQETPPKPAITELELPQPCFSPQGVSADFNCDGKINAIDFNEFLIKFGTSRTNASAKCKFNADFDLYKDGKVDAVDFNDFLIVFGSSE